MPYYYKKFLSEELVLLPSSIYKTVHCPPRLPASSVIVKDGTGQSTGNCTQANKATRQSNQSTVAELLQQACNEIVKSHSGKDNAHG